MRTSIQSQTLLKLGVGSILSAFGGLSIVLTMIFNPFAGDVWYAFPLGFLTGLATGCGVVLLVHSLIMLGNQ